MTRPTDPRIVRRLDNEWLADVDLPISGTDHAAVSDAAGPEGLHSQGPAAQPESET